MMKIEQKKISAFVDTLRAMVPECRLMITPDGISTLAVDTANVAMVSANLPATAFTEYHEEKYELGMNVDRWKTAIDLMKAGPVSINREASGRIIFTGGSYTLTHVPLDPSTVRKRPNSPAINLPAAVVIDSKEYAETVRAMAVIGDKVRVSITGNLVELAAEGDTDNIRKGIVAKDGSPVNTATATSLFSIDYLRDTARAMKDAGNITLHAGQDHPVRFDFELEGGEYSFLIAPRIEQDGGE